MVNKSSMARLSQSHLIRENTVKAPGTQIRRFPPLEAQDLRFQALWLAALFLFALPGTAACDTAAGEYNLKAAFIYNFAKFVEWPESAFRGKRDFCIATLGRTPLDRELAALSGKSIQGLNEVSCQ